MRNTDEIRTFVIENIDNHPRDIVPLVAQVFSISRQAAHRHIGKMIKENIIKADGATKNRKYELLPVVDQTWNFALKGLEEDKVWRNAVAPVLGNLPENVLKICQHGLTEMVNNAIDHSEGKKLSINVTRSPASVRITVGDNGIGIFKKITRDLKLDDPLHAILELSKGKLTTDPEKHSGEGIFFTSRMFDDFSILSSELFFNHSYGNSGEEDQDWLLEARGKKISGTLVDMSIATTSKRTTREVFDLYSVDGDFGFSKTRVPVFLAQYGGENLVSRSQAKRLLARFERFKEIILNFRDVPSIGQAFADEIFRVFRNAHPDTHLFPTNTNEEVASMIAHVEAENQPKE